MRKSGKWEQATPRDDAAQLRLIADNIPVMSIAYDENLRCLFANRRFAEFFGLTTATIVGRHLREIIGDGPFREVKPYFDRVLQGHRTAYERTRIVDGGDRRYLEVELIPHHDQGGRIRGLFAVTTDVTERKREEQLRLLGHTVAELIAGADNSTAAVQAVIRAICVAEHWDCGRYFRPSRDAAMLRLADAWGIEDASIQEFLQRARHIQQLPGIGLVGEVWRSGQALWVAEVAKEARALRTAYPKALRSGGAFVFPVMSQGVVIGVLAFNSRERRAPDERLLQVILDIGGQIGQFLQRKHAEEQLRESEASLAEAQRLTQQLIEASPIPIFFKGTDGRYLGVNKAWEDYFATPRDAFVGKTVHDLYPQDPEIADRLHAMDQALWDRPGSQTYETTIRTPDGQTHDAIYYKATFTRADGGVAGLIGTIIDITDRKRVEENLRRFRAAMDASGDAILLIDRASMRYIDVNQTFCDLVGYTRQEMLGMTPMDLFSADRETLERDYDALIAGSAHRASKIEGQYRHRDGTLIPIETQRRALRTKDGWIIVGSARDITERKQAEDRIRHLADHDSLTGLPNRRLFADRLSQAISIARREAGRCALLYLDLDKFKPVNDTLGHDAGDRLLQKIADTIRALVRESDTVARVGGDEFTVLLRNISSSQNAAAVADKIVAALSAPFRLENYPQEITIGASVGIALFPDDAQDHDTLITKADAAMYVAKARGERFRFAGAA
jgi:diguanylate cyclase (GGDEF)-like protein/PAS domain S-box-containing protein